MVHHANEDYPRVLLIESDPAVVDQITGILSEYALTIEVIHDGADVRARALASLPALILLCVELPDGKNGYALCNKMRKKSPLKDIPLLILSSEGSAEIFEQHGGLKTRADGYLHKPLDLQQLVAAIFKLIDLKLANAVEGSHPAFGSSGRTEDTNVMPIAVDDGGDTGSAEEAPAPIHAVLSAIDQEIGQEIGQEMGQDLGRDSEVQALDPEELSTGVDFDVDIDQETDAAFAAMEVEGASDPNDKPIVITAAEATFDPRLKAAGAPQVAPEVAPLDIPEDDDAELVVESVALIAEENAGAPPPTPMDSDLDSNLEAVHDSLPSGGRNDDPSRASEVLSLKERIADLELDNRELTEKLRNAQSTGPSSRDREMLTLREVINRKEKEILDLKDGLDGKERQILDQKEKVHELQRKASDMDDRLLGLERELIDGHETVSALKDDKNKAVEREASVKTRLEEAKVEIDKAYGEIDSLRARHSEELETLGGELKTELADKEAKFTQQLADKEQAFEDEKRILAEKHLEALQDQANAGQQEIETLRAAERDKRDELGREHDKALEELKQAFEAQKGALRDEHRVALDELARDHEGALARERSDAAQRLSEQQDSALAEMERQETDFSAQIAELKDANVEALRSETERSARALETREAEHAGEKELMRTEHQADIENLKRKYDEAASAAESAHLDALDSSKQASDARIEELTNEHKESLAQSQAELNRVRDDLSRRLEAKEAEAEILKGDLQRSEQGRRDAERSLEEVRDNAERSQKNYREAKAQISNDAALAEKAKRAMAIAITLLEEQQANSNGSAAQPLDSGSEA